jgi:hypothetical protein
MQQMRKECIWVAAWGSVPGDKAVRKHKQTKTQRPRDDKNYLEGKKIHLKPKPLVRNWTVQDMTGRTIAYHMKMVNG